MGKVLSNEEIFAFTKEAFKHNEFVLLLEGKGKYACKLDRFVPADMPTDVGRIIQEGIYKLYLEKHEKEVINKYREAVVEIMNGDCTEVWLAYHICWTQIYKEKRANAPFKFFNETILNELRKNIFSHEEELKQTKKWQGANLEEGLWEDIQTLENTSYKFLGVKLL